MSTRRSRSPSSSLAAQLAELAVATPQVVAHRVTRMALSGPTPSARDRKEFGRMVAEKQVAFAQSWMAMFTQAAAVNQAMAASWLGAVTSAAQGKPPSAATLAELQQAAQSVLGKGLAPVHRRAVANARRLSRTKLR